MKFLSRAALAALLTLGLVLSTGVAAASAAEPDPSIIQIAVGGGSLSLVDILQLGVIPLLPAIIGYVNRVTSIPAFWKRLILALLAIGSQMVPDFIQALTTGVEYNWLLALFSGLIAYALAEATYQGFYKKSVSNSSDATIASKIAGT